MKAWLIYKPQGYACKHYAVTQSKELAGDYAQRYGVVVEEIPCLPGFDCALPSCAAPDCVERREVEARLEAAYPEYLWEVQ